MTLVYLIKAISEAQSPRHALYYWQQLLFDLHAKDGNEQTPIREVLLHTFNTFKSFHKITNPSVNDVQVIQAFLAHLSGS